jgi:hypothetical protein
MDKSVFSPFLPQDLIDFTDLSDLAESADRADGRLLCESTFFSLLLTSLFDKACSKQL